MASYFSALGDESYLGTADADTIHTGTGSDTITGGAGNDSLFGGAGTDVAVFLGNRADYRIGWSASRGALAITDLNVLEAGDEGTDVLVGIETLQFADGMYSLAPGGEVRVSQFVTSDHRYPVVAGLSGGGHVAAFEYGYSATPVFEIDQAAFDTAGHFTGAFEQEDRANTTTTDDQQRPAVAALTGGGYIVAWQSYLQDGSSWGIYARQFDAVGTPLGNESLVNTTVTAGQRSPAAAGLSNGGYVVAWQALDSDGDGIFAQRFDANGTAVGTETRLNDATARSQINPALAGLAGGGYVAVWDGTDVIESASVYQGIWLRRFDASASSSVVTAGLGAELFRQLRPCPTVDSRRRPGLRPMAPTPPLPLRRSEVRLRPRKSRRRLHGDRHQHGRRRPKAPTPSPASNGSNSATARPNSAGCSPTPAATARAT
jgi:hypothetical protein